ncbi:ATP-binding protein [Streptosporangium sp. G11]|uniref:ATP-binding protein n=1 Tax=Streptosporangium sp. G11 TaxID=3436926 RepID=UPI003EBF65A6
MTARLLSILVGVFADRFRTTADDPTGSAATMWSPHLGRIPGWSTIPSHTPVISQRFPATRDQVRNARNFVAEILGDDHPLRDNAMLLTSELATNAVEHSGRSIAKEAIDAEPTDTKPADAELSDIEADDIGTADTEPDDIEATNVEASGVGAADIRTDDGEPIGTEPGDRPGEFVVTVAFLPHGVIITVQDSGFTRIPCTGNPSPYASGGRGLLLVNDLASRWGFHRDPTGTVIWFELT